MPSQRPIDYRTSPPLTNDALNTLFASVWDDHAPMDFAPVLRRSLVWIGAFEAGTLVGFVNVAWDGGEHAFLLDTTVHAEFQRRGIGTQLVASAIAAVREHGMKWLHVDYEARYEAFYRSCGFRPTLAGLIRVDEYDQ